MLGRSLKIAALLLLTALAAAAQTIPAGTRLTVRVGSEISSGTAKAGDRFDATLARPLVVNGKTVATASVQVPFEQLYEACAKLNWAAPWVASDHGKGALTALICTVGGQLRTTAPATELINKMAATTTRT